MLLNNWSNVISQMALKSKCDVSILFPISIVAFNWKNLKRILFSLPNLSYIHQFDAPILAGLTVHWRTIVRSLSRLIQIQLLNLFT